MRYGFANAFARCNQDHRFAAALALSRLAEKLARVCQAGTRPNFDDFGSTMATIPNVLLMNDALPVVYQCTHVTDQVTNPPMLFRVATVQATTRPW